MEYIIDTQDYILDKLENLEHLFESRANNSDTITYAADALQYV